MRLLVRALVGLLVVIALAGCGVIPRDPEGTLERVQSEGVLRAGASPSEVTEQEMELVTRFAEELGVEVEWTEDGETALVAAMERAELDVIVGGMESDSPWSDKVSVTRAYASSVDPEGATVKHVMAVPAGENAMLVRLERFLDEVTP